jgi:hypothetical protein
MYVQGVQFKFTQYDFKGLFMLKKLILTGLLVSLHVPIWAMEESQELDRAFSEAMRQNAERESKEAREQWPEEELYEGTIDLQEYIQAVANGTVNGAVNLYELAKHPVDNFLIPAGMLVNDVRIIEACRDMGLNYDPAVNCAAEFEPAQDRMGERWKDLQNYIQEFVAASGPKRVEILTSMAVTSMVPGTAVRGVTKIAANKYKFGVYTSPNKFNNLHPDDLNSRSSISYEEFRSLNGKTTHKWAITTDGKLHLSHPYHEGLLEIKHPDIVNGKPVIAAGMVDAYFGRLGGKAKKGDFFSGHFRTYGEELKRIVPYIFKKHGFDDFKLKQEPFIPVKGSLSHALPGESVFKLRPIFILPLLAEARKAELQSESQMHSQDEAPQAAPEKSEKATAPNSVPAEPVAPAATNSPMKEPASVDAKTPLPAPSKVAASASTPSKAVVAPKKSPPQAKIPAPKARAKAIPAKAPVPAVPPAKAVAPKKVASKSKVPLTAPKTPAKTKVVPVVKAVVPKKVSLAKAAVPKKVASKSKISLPAPKAPAKAKLVPVVKAVAPKKMPSAKAAAPKKVALKAKVPALAPKAPVKTKVASKLPVSKGAKAPARAKPKVNVAAEAKRKLEAIINNLSAEEKKKIRKGRTSWVQIVDQKVQLAGPAVFRAWVERKSPGIFSSNPEVRATAKKKAEKKAKKLMRDAWLGKYDPDNIFFVEDAEIIARVTAPWMMDKWLAGKGGSERGRISDIHNNPFGSFESNFWKSSTQPTAPTQSINNNNNAPSKKNNNGESPGKGGTAGKPACPAGTTHRGPDGSCWKLDIGIKFG